MVITLPGEAMFTVGGGIDNITDGGGIGIP